MEALLKLIMNLDISEEDRQLLLAEIKPVKKQLEISEFKYRRTIMDKSAITNVLNNTIAELEQKKRLIENARNEIAKNMVALDEQNQVIAIKNEALNKTISKLKATQSQLVQSEKMASLGELTAGIAHEIQNPLNFVNNFAEISSELVDEMNEELDKGDTEEAKAISTDIKQNLEKINHHGKRADAIVKGMLQHSRISNGKKELTDINALADEYLRLSYHGLRAKDKSFNADFKTDFVESLPKINVIPQDIGRVLLNLINNAFYAVNERSKKGEEGYKPTVSVSTAKARDKLEIKVADNGNGIPENIKEKIFQPFFTTKPTGQGTGLGLSLSYDIMKAHGGSIKINSESGVFTEFIVQLPDVITENSEAGK